MFYRKKPTIYLPPLMTSRFLLPHINYTYADLFHAVVKSDTYEYILYCVLGSDTAVNYAFVFDYKVGGIFPYDGFDIRSSSCYLMSTNKAKLLYCAGYTGYLSLQERRE